MSKPRGIIFFKPWIIGGGVVEKGFGLWVHIHGRKGIPTLMSALYAFTHVYRPPRLHRSGLR
jgi:hypothetical protein